MFCLGRWTGHMQLLRIGKRLVLLCPWLSRKHGSARETTIIIVLFLACKLACCLPACCYLPPDQFAWLPEFAVFVMQTRRPSAARQRIYGARVEAVRYRNMLICMLRLILCVLDRNAPVSFDRKFIIPPSAVNHATYLYALLNIQYRYVNSFFVFLFRFLSFLYTASDALSEFSVSHDFERWSL